MTRRPHIAGPAHAQLRERAERAVAASTSQPPAGADSDQLRRWHELQVSQIELDLQNEALARLQKADGSWGFGLLRAPLSHQRRRHHHPLFRGHNSFVHRGGAAHA